MVRARRLLSHLGMAPSVIRALDEASFLYDDEVKDLTPTELQEATGLRVSECCEVLRLVTSVVSSAPITVLDMVERGGAVEHVLTLSSALDQLLGGGLALRAVTELAGTPGIGKTQICMQACVSVQLPECVGGLGAEAVYIDAEGSVAPARLREMAQYAVDHVRRLRAGDATPDVTRFTVEDVLKRVHYYRCLSQISVVSCIKQLGELIKQRPNIKLIVLDSIAFHLRHDIPDNRVRTAMLCTITQDLIKIATTHGIAVVVTNQMTTRINHTTSSSTSSSSELVPALGESWSHCPTIRVVLRWQAQQRTASLIKAPHLPNGEVCFQVTAAGIRDVAAARPSTPPTHTNKRKLGQIS